MLYTHILVLILTGGGERYDAGVAVSQQNIPFMSAEACARAETTYKQPSMPAYLESKSRYKNIVIDARCWPLK